MRILHVISSTNPKGGGPIEGIRQLMKPLEDLGVSADILCCDPPDAPWLSNTESYKVYALGSTSGRYRYSKELLPWLRTNTNNYDAVIVNGLWQYPSFAVWRALAGMPVPYYVFPHGMLGPWFKKKFPLKHLKKWLYWPWAEYRVLRDARAVIFTCEEERVLARDSFWLYRCNEVVTKFGTASPPENGGELRDKFLSAYPLLAGKRLFLFLGRIHQVKGCDLLIEAFSRIANLDSSLHLVMAGPGHPDLVEKLQIQAMRLGVGERITWTGMLRDDLKWGAFHACEVFVLTSHHENFGVVVAEALACGKPVLISNKVNIWREISLEKAGFVADDTVEGAEKILRCWLSTNQMDRVLMNQRAAECFHKNFHINQAAERLVKIISGY